MYSQSSVSRIQATGKEDDDFSLSERELTRQRNEKKLSKASNIHPNLNRLRSSF